jgi:hypothetical protein
VAAGGATDLVALDDAMNALAAISPRRVQVVEMRFPDSPAIRATV